MTFNKNHIYLITGGTGSFGKKMLRYLIKENKFSEVRILSRDEKKQEDLRLQINDKRVKFYIGDVRDQSSIIDAFENVDYVFHAAALKQVPSCEFYPLEAVKTNINGTENVVSSSIYSKVKTLVLLSTDKAVYPVNSMGLTKAIAEKIIISKSRLESSKTILCATRYGNVMGSRGSVIPLFINQILNNKPITITDPNMTRFLMSLEDSISLVFKAFKTAKSGDIFVKKANSVTIQNLVDALKEIFNSNIKTQIIGTRHGEKLYETLVSREELARAKETKNYFQIKADMRSLNYDEFFIKGAKGVSHIEDYNSNSTKNLNVKETIEILNKLDFVNEALKK